MAGQKILVADDSLTIQKVIRLALSNEGYDIQAISDGNDAVQQISLFRPDIVLIDVSLPGKSAFEVKRAINELLDFEEVRFVLMSSAFEKVDEDQAEEVKFHSRLTKPFDPAHLRQILTEVMDQVTLKRREPTKFIEQPRMPASPPPPPKAPDVLATSWTDPVVSQKQEVVTQLWDQDQSQSEDEGLSLGSRGSSSGDDIKHLTESTIRMSGLDDFQWSVQEPSLKNPQKESEKGADTYFNAPTEPAPELPTGLDETFSSSLPDMDLPPPRMNVAAATAAAPELAITDKLLEEIVHKQVYEAVQKLAQQLLPQVAERVIKEEIHRLLSM